MMNTRRRPVCGSTDVIRAPDAAHRYLANSVCITRFATVKRVPVARYVCYDCGYVENRHERDEIKRAWGRPLSRLLSRSSLPR